MQTDQANSFARPARMSRRSRSPLSRPRSCRRAIGTRRSGASRFLALKFPAYAPPGSDVTGATFTNVYRSNTAGDTTCFYFEVYSGGDLLATYGSPAAPVSCNGTSEWVTQAVPIAEVNTPEIANDVTIVLYVSNSGARKSQHRLVTLGVAYSLAAP